MSQRNPSRPGKKKCRTPAPPVIDWQNQKGSNRTANRGSAVKECRGQRSFFFWKPLRHRFSRARPVGRFAQSEETAKSNKTAEALRQRSQNRDNGIPNHSDRKTASCADPIQQSAKQSLTQRICDAKCDDYVAYSLLLQWY